MPKAKPYRIPKPRVWDADQQVKANRGAAGGDGESLAACEHDRKRNRYQGWNRMASGAYFPPPVRLGEIPKASGGTRPLGIPTVADRGAQPVVKMVLEPLGEPSFHPDSYGYRPGRSALDAVGVARQRCWDADGGIDLDIQACLDSLEHALVERAVAHHTDLPWGRLAIARGLRAPVQRPDGTREPRTQGTPQGGVASPLLANRFLHSAFEAWMQRAYPRIRFERYADDGLVHGPREPEAQAVRAAIRGRFQQGGLAVHPPKTRLVYGKDDDRPGEHEHVQFDFLGFTFHPRRAKHRWGKFFGRFLPAISPSAATAIRQPIREWRMAATRNHQSLEAVARLVPPGVRGGLTYDGRVYRSRVVQVLRHRTEALAAWARWQYQRVRRRERAARHWLGRIARRAPPVFAQWALGVRPEAGGYEPDDARVSRPVP